MEHHHIMVHVRQFSDHGFHNNWIGMRDPIEWPARFPDLLPLDFFFFFCGGAIKI